MSFPLHMTVSFHAFTLGYVYFCNSVKCRLTTLGQAYGLNKIVCIYALECTYLRHLQQIISFLHLLQYFQTTSLFLIQCWTKKYSLFNTILNLVIKSIELVINPCLTWELKGHFSGKRSLPLRGQKSQHDPKRNVSLTSRPRCLE